MKLILQDKKRFLLRFDKGEEVIAKIAEFMTEHGVSACSFSAIGSAAEIELGYYNQFLKEYRRKSYAEGLEIISLNGNGGVMEGKPAIHAHGMFGRTDFSVLGGHVFKIVVLATCEAELESLEGEITRGKSDEFNLNLLQ